MALTTPGPWPTGPTVERLRRLALRSREVVLLAALTGVVTGFVVALFESVVVEVVLERVLSAPLWVQALMPVTGLVIAAVVLRIGGGWSPSTSDEYLEAFHDPSHRLPGKALVSRVGASIATIGLGGPMGLEGPSIYIGATTGSLIQRRLPRPFRGSDHRTLLVAGAAAGVAAIFKAPATGAVFALEVPYRDDLARRMLLPALVASASGYLSFVLIHDTTPLFVVEGAAAFNLRDLVGAVLLGVVAGLGARWFAIGIGHAKRWTRIPIVARLAVAGSVLVALFVVVRLAAGESLLLGPGLSVVQWASAGDHTIWILLVVLVARCLATTAVVGGGGVGGLFVPLVVAGALVGRITGDAIHTLDPTLFTVIGIAAFLGAGYRVPLAAVMFVAETTGRPGFIVPGLLAAVSAELVVGSVSVTDHQVSPTR